MKKHQTLALSLLLAGTLLGAAPREAFALEFFVDAATGDDRRSPLEAQSPATPWASIGQALRTVTAGHTIFVAPGVYPESVETGAAGVAVVALPAEPPPEGAGAVVVEPPAGSPGFLIQHDDVLIEGFVVRARHQGLVAAKSKAGDLLRGLVVRGLRVEPPAGVMIATNGIQVRDAERVTIESNVVRGAGQQGILLKRVSHAWVRNNLVYGQQNDWGISIDGDTPGQAPLQVGNVAAFNTVWANERGLRFRNSSGEIHDNVVSENALTGIKYDQPDAVWAVHHNDAWGSAVNYDLPSGVKPDASNRSVAPRFVDAAAGDFALRQVSGEQPWSPLIDAGSMPAAGTTAALASAGASSGSTAAGSAATAATIDGSTASDGRPDTEMVDPGYHREASFSSAPPGGYGPRPSPTPTPTPSPTPSPSPTPRVGEGPRIHVDCASGADERTKSQALDPSTPWRTLRRAALSMTYGDVAVVQPGVCAESVETNANGVAFVAAEPGSVVLEPPAGQPGFNVQNDDVLLEGFVIRARHQGVLAAKSKAGDVLRGLVVRNLRIEPRAATIATNGIQVRDAERVTIESNVVRGAEQQGILLKRVSRAYVRNNLVHGQPNDWGISIDGDTPGKDPLLVGNVAAFNTVWGNKRGLRFRNSAGEIRDNVVSENTLAGIKYDQPDAAWAVHHNDAWGSVTDYDLPSGIKTPPSNRSVDPGLVDPAAGSFSLRQASGEAPPSPLIDAGSGPADAPEIDIGGSTASDGRPDVGFADPGYHRDAPPCTAPPGGIGPRPSPTATPVPTPSPTPTPTPSPTPAGPVPPGSGASYWVDPLAGDDARSPAAARAATTPWRSLGRALASARAGDVVRLRPGTYFEQADFNADAITLRGDGPLGSVVLVPPAGKAGVYVDGFASPRIENLVVESAAQGVLVRGSSDVRIHGVAVIGSGSNGISVRDSADAWIESSIVASSGAIGIKVVRSAPVYLRSNLVYDSGDWGISLDHTIPKGGVREPSSGNVIAFNTVHANRAGVRLLDASGEVRDNALTGQSDLGLYVAAAGVTVHHNVFAGNGRDRDRDRDIVEDWAAWANVDSDPRYVAPAGRDGILGGAGWADDDFRLMRLATDGKESKAVDAGSGAVAALDIGGSTSTDGVADTGVADVGFHYGAPHGTSVPPPMPIGDNLQATFHVHAALGDDARPPSAARRPETPWRTIERALRSTVTGDTVVVHEGTYAETAQVKVAGVKLVAAEPGRAVLRPPAGNGVTVEAPDVTIDGLVVQSASTGVSILPGADDVVVRNCGITSAFTDGIRAVDVRAPTVEHSVIASARGSGIRLKRVDGSHLKNNLVYASGEWGVSIDTDGAPSAEHLVAETTLYRNAAGGVQVRGAPAWVRNNLVVESGGPGLRLPTSGVVLEHNGFSANATPIDPPNLILSCAACAENRSIAPRFANPIGDDGVLGGSGWTDDDFRLSAGDESKPRSAAVDFGSDLVDALGVTGSAVTTGAPDEGRVDLGFHYEAGAGALVLPTASTAVPRRRTLPPDVDLSSLSGDAVAMYGARPTRETPAFRVGPIRVEDAFGILDFDVARPAEIGLPLGGDAPSAAAGEGWLDYRLRPLARTARVEMPLRAASRCEQIDVRVARADGLLVPSRVRSEAAQETALPPYLCRRASSSAGTSSVRSSGATLRLAVGGDPAAAWDVVGTSRLCTPATLSGTPAVLRGPRHGERIVLPEASAVDPDRALLCYRVRPASAAAASQTCALPGAVPIPGSTSGLALSNALGETTVDVSSVREICLPASTTARAG